MELKEAIKLASEFKTTKGKKIVNGIEYDSYFVFDYRLHENLNVNDSLIGVNKKDKSVCVFFPLMISRKEFVNGKIIPQEKLKLYSNS